MRPRLDTDGIDIRRSEQKSSQNERRYKEEKPASKTSLEASGFKLADWSGD